MNPIFWIMLLAPALSFANERVRHVEYHTDQIVTVRTALGIATIIQVPDRPNSVVVGDQDKFKVEYLDQAITIKPLQAGEKSNLYIYTDYQRYNVQLVTGAEASSDFVIYLENIKPKAKKKAAPLRWTPFVRSVSNDEITFESKRLGRASEGVFLIEFQIRAAKKTVIKPEWFWLIQEKETRPIQSLFIATADLAVGENTQGVIQILGRDIDLTKAIRIELRRKKTSFLTIPRMNQWK
ncbi:MAG: TrbG/VirB9 family P-type conjugative transfer protein [Pseudomonadota bacterium]|nr:TrbG/VirB9 family P-type conjugative transfer protein [Pseudomonadota bacterium]